MRGHLRARASVRAAWLALCGPGVLLRQRWSPLLAQPPRRSPAPHGSQDVSLDRVGALELHQLMAGNRITCDDVLCAWAATRAASASSRRPKPRRVLELGSGCGSVGLLTLSRLPQARATLVECQEVSVGLLRRNIAHNGLEERAEVLHGDLREVLRDVHPRYDLVLSNPPYMPASIGALPKHPQKAYARFELRGGVEDFAAAAGRALVGGGRAVFVHSDAARTRSALEGAGLLVEHSIAVMLHEGAAPRRCVVLASRRAEEDGALDAIDNLDLPSSVAVHSASNTPTAAWRQICVEVGFPARTGSATGAEGGA
mmetsp:Transcript_22679/g.63274  ORF Transcript_22679/g.63274 Transcript_22679/m.63274 type:complete len:314 (-) Transcript_22679:9-950(-)